MSHKETLLMQPGEVRRVTFDFLGDGYGTRNCKLADGDTVASVVDGAIEHDAGVTVSAPSIVEVNKVTALVSAPTSRHTLHCRVTTTNGETLELDVDVRAADGEN